jgi:hypothetical protein
VNADCRAPLPIEQLVDYAAGELSEADETTLEEHLFACEPCARALERVMRLGAGIGRCVREGRIATPATDDLVRHLSAAGARIREYRLAPGDTVPCTAAPDDTFVAVRLAVPIPEVTSLSMDVDFHDLATGAREAQHTEDVPIDRTSGEVVMLFPGELIRTYPRSRWTMHMTPAEGSAALGPYVLDHLPWNIDS